MQEITARKKYNELQRTDIKSSTLSDALLTHDLRPSAYRSAADCAVGESHPRALPGVRATHAHVVLIPGRNLITSGQRDQLMTIFDVAVNIDTVRVQRRVDEPFVALLETSGCAQHVLSRSCNLQQ